jgi:hypothetical protein
MMGGGREEVRELSRGTEIIKVVYIHGWDALRNPFEH